MVEGQAVRLEPVLTNDTRSVRPWLQIAGFAFALALSV